MRIFDFLLDFLFPRFCLNCGHDNEYICDKCLGKIKLIKRDVCPICEELSLLGETHRKCRGRLKIDGMIVGADYNDEIVRIIIHKFKYQNATASANELIEKFISPKLTHQLLNYLKIDAITFIPLHADKERKRGFNQSEILAREIGKKLHIPVVNLLKRVVYNPPQMSVKKIEDRKKNVRGIFRPSPLASARGYGTASPLSSGKLNVLLVDDVATSGATLFEATRVLKENGISFIWGLVLARKQKHV